MVKTLFIGTSEFAIPILEKLLGLQYIELVGVITQPDKPVGRKQVLTPSPIKYWSLVNSQRSNVVIYQPEKLKLETERILQECEPELIIVASYGQFIPKVMLEYPKYKCLNIHASLLPDLRGAVPMPMAILKGYEETGVSIQIMEEGMDEGALIGSRKQEIGDRETTLSLTHKLSNLAADLLEDILPGWISREIEPVIQDVSKASYCYQKDISKEKAEINFNLSTLEIDRMVRAFNPWPIAWLNISKQNTSNQSFWGKRLKIYEAKPVFETDIGVGVSEGSLFRHRKQLFLKTSDGLLDLVLIQLEGKKEMSGVNYFFLL